MVCRWLSCSLFSLVGFTPLPASSANPQVVHSTSDAGGIGLLQMPSARFGDDGYFSFGISRVLPYDNLHLTLLPLPWFEGVFRYTDVTNRPYSRVRGFGEGQSYKDRGFDFKLRLLEESSSFPELSLGIRDFAGTGIFGGEYLVASRRYYDFDFTLGMAWGRLGARGGVNNPLTLFSNGFKRRAVNRADSGRVTGVPQTSRWFRGEEVALFGGMEWVTPLRGLTLKMEYDGNNYRNEPLNNDQPVNSPVNAAFNYKAWDALDLSVGLERGNTFMLRIGTSSNFNRDTGPPKLFDPPPPLAAAAPPADNGDFVASLREAARKQELAIQALDVRPDEHSVQVWYGNGTYRNQAKALGRLSRALASVAPPGIEIFTLTSVNGGLNTAETTLLRREVERAARYEGSAEEVWSRATFTSPIGDSRSATHPGFAEYPQFSYGMSPALRQHVGGPDSFYFYQLWWRVSGRLELTDNLSLSASVGFDLHNNFDGLRQRSFSRLPHVRSDIVKYLKEGENNLVRLETNYIWSPVTDWYARLSAGIFEEMYGGAGGEILYRPYGDRWALGLNANRVRQRDFDQRFGFRKYEVNTGHLTVYYEPPWYNTLIRVSGGRYLAGDVGTTLDFSRQFLNGVRAGIFATFTNVSARDFGEGSFDKGFYFNVPLDLFFSRSSRRYAGFGFRPLTRDGGQKVRDGQELYPLVDGMDPGSLARDWSGFMD